MIRIIHQLPRLRVRLSLKIPVCWGQDKRTVTCTSCGASNDRRNIYCGGCGRPLGIS